MSEDVQPSAPAPAATTVSCESPPLAAQPPRDHDVASDARARLLQLAAELMRSHNRRLVIEYLRLRRAIA
jgi:hypothetical protein